MRWRVGGSSGTVLRERARIDALAESAESADSAVKVEVVRFQVQVRRRAEYSSLRQIAGLSRSGFFAAVETKQRVRIQRDAVLTADPVEGEAKTLEQRQAEALMVVFTHAMDKDTLPSTSRVRPHITLTINYEQLQEKIRGTMLELGRQTDAAELHRIACDCDIPPTVLSDDSQPLDVGRTKRTTTFHQRAAVIARD